MNSASKFDRLPKAMASVRRFSPSKAIVATIVGVLLYFAHVAFVPVAMALLSGLILSGPVEALHKKGIPRSASAVVILILSLAAVTGLVMLLWSPTQQWVASAPHTISIIKQRISPISQLMGHLENLRASAASIEAQKHAAPAPVAPAVAPQESIPVMILDVTRDAVAAVLAFVIITLFLLAGGPPMIARMTVAFFDHLKANHVLVLIEKVRAEVGHFYVTTTLINVGLGVTTTIAMMAWHMPTPYLWGALAAGLNFIPYAGSATTLIVLTLVALVSFNSVGHIIGVAGTYVALAALEGQIAQPLLVGRRMEVNPLLIFLGLWFGGLFWGIAGVILATPVLVALKVIAENSRDGKGMMEFLGPNNQSPYRGAKFRRLTNRKAPD